MVQWKILTEGKRRVSVKLERKLREGRLKFKVNVTTRRIHLHFRVNTDSNIRFVVSGRLQRKDTVEYEGRSASQSWLRRTLLGSSVGNDEITKAIVMEEPPDRSRSLSLALLLVPLPKERAHTYARLQSRMDYVDAAPLLDATLRDLEGTAHLVRDERYPMLELMSAIEINDPRTDTFLHARQQLPASGEFDPARQLEYSNSDLLDISNHLLQLEVSPLLSFPSYAHAETTRATGHVPSRPSARVDPLDLQPPPPLVPLDSRLVRVRNQHRLARPPPRDSEMLRDRTSRTLERSGLRGERAVFAAKRELPSEKKS